MKLLFDQNLSHRLCRVLADISPEAAQVRSLGMDEADDLVIWEFARREGFVVVTLDADFADIGALRGAPPKIIWLRCGNQPTRIIEGLIRTHAPLIETFLQDAEATCLEIY